MRTTSQNFGVIAFDDVIAGVALGADYCAEHEWGFRWKRELGIPEKPTHELCGIAARVNYKNDMKVVLDRFGKRKELALLVIVPFHLERWTAADWIKRFGGDWQTSKLYDDLTEDERKLPYKDKPLADVRTSWDDRSGFLIIAQTPRGEEAIKVVHEALMANELAVGYGSDANPFSRPGINLIDVQKIPQKIRDAIRLGDLDHLDLEETVEKTGIRERLQAAGRHYYALSPRWDDRAKKTVKFWLNPMDQDKNNYGWFTVEELDQWIKGEGPIPMKKATA